MKKIFKLLLFLMLFLIPFYVKAAVVEIDSNNAVMYNMKDHTIIYEKNKDDTIKVASMQKIMTTIVAIEHINDYNQSFVLDTSIFAGMDPDAALVGFYNGEVITYNDLLYGTMIRSGADAAYGLGVMISGSEEEFVNLMNEKAKQIGLTNTVFKNTIGLDDPEQYSTVSDIATLLEYAMKNEKFREIVNTPRYTTSDGEITFGGPLEKARNHGMDYFVGGKTGYTEEAGLCLASYASKDGIDYILVTAGANYHIEDQNFYDHKALYDYFMNNYSYKKIMSRGKLIKKIKTMYDDEVEIKATRDVTMYLENEITDDELKYEYIGKEELDRSIKEGDKIGKITVSYNDTVLYEEDVLSPITVKFKLKPIFIIVLLILIISILIHLIRRKRRKIKRMRR